MSQYIVMYTASFPGHSKKLLYRYGEAIEDGYGEKAGLVLVQMKQKQVIFKMVMVK